MHCVAQAQYQEHLGCAEAEPQSPSEIIQCGLLLKAFPGDCIVKRLVLCMHDEFDRGHCLPSRALPCRQEVLRHISVMVAARLLHRQDICEELTTG
eukprot:4230269-Amphidinium_carterae.1